MDGSGARYTRLLVHTPTATLITLERLIATHFIAMNADIHPTTKILVAVRALPQRNVRLELPDLATALTVDRLVSRRGTPKDPVAVDIGAELPRVRVLGVHLRLDPLELARLRALAIPFIPENEMKISSRLWQNNLRNASAYILQSLFPNHSS